MFCPKCGKEVSEDSDFCPSCGSHLKLETAKNVSVKAPIKGLKNPGLAAVLSFFIVGLGQIYNGQIGKGLILLVFYIISLVLCLVLIGFILVPILWIYGIYDAYKTAEKINAGEIAV
jgi:TM2 domain-containing membrane protein YozV